MSQSHAFGDPRRGPISTTRALPILLTMQQGRCADCGVRLAHRTIPGSFVRIPGDTAWTYAPGHRGAQVDHIVPKSAGGPDRLSNYAAVCPPCNVDRWRAWRALSADEQRARVIDALRAVAA